MYMGIDIQAGVNGGRVNIVIQQLLWLYITEAHISMTGFGPPVYDRLRFLLQ